MAQIADLMNVSYKTIANNCTQLKRKSTPKPPWT